MKPKKSQRTRHSLRDRIAATTQEKYPSPDLAFVKLDFLIGTKCRFNVGRRVKSGGNASK
jgi:hypothetical protein